MKIYIYNSTGNLCLLTNIDIFTRKFTMEFEWGNMTPTVKEHLHINSFINDNFTYIGDLE